MKTSPSNQSPSSPPGSSGGKVQDVKEAATEKVRQLKDTAASSLTRARDEAQHFAAEKKSDVAERIGGYGTAIHESARSLEEKDPNIAWFTHRAADRIDRVADYVRRHDFRELRGDAEDVARRHPALFFGGLFVAGLLLGNVVKASRRGRQDFDESGMSDEPDSSDWAAGATPSMSTDAATPAAGL